MHTYTKIKGQSPLAKWGSLGVLSLALAIIVIDTTLLNVSLKTIILDLHTDFQSMQWVITVYSLILAALTITGGRMGDIFGRKRMFMAGAVIFAVGSFLASISTNLPMLLIGESIIEGIGAALMMPATASLLVSNFEGRERALAFGVWGGVAAAASAIGPILGGYLTSNFSWRWGFRINVFVVLILLIGSFLIREARDRKEKPQLDIVGVFLSGFGLLSVVFGIIESSDYGWWMAKQVFSVNGANIDILGLSIAPVAITLGIILLFMFCIWEAFVELENATPLVSLGLFKNRQFISGALTTAVVSLGQIGLIFAVPVLLQSTQNLDALHTGYALLPLSIALLVAAPFSAKISNKIAPKALIQIGLIINILAAFVLRASLSADASVWTLAPGLLIYGTGMGMIMAQSNNLTLSAVSVQQSGEASGVNNTLRQVGSSLGSAIIGAVMLGSIGTNMIAGVNASTKIPEPYKEAIVKSAGQSSSDAALSGDNNQLNQLPPDLRTEITNIKNTAIVESAQKALLYTASFTFLGLIVSLGLSNSKHIAKGKPTGGH